MFGTVPDPEGITNPPIDDLLDRVESKYALAAYSANRARQINAYRQEMKRGDGNVSHFGPLVEADPEDKPLSVALQEISAGKIAWSTQGE